MQRKLKLSFYALMTSSFFIKIANADGVATLKEKLLTPVGINEHLEETRKLLSKVRGLKEKEGGAKMIVHEKTIEESKLSEEERKGEENLFFEVLTNSIISDGMAIYITNGTSEDSEINSFSYKEAGYSIDNTVRKDGKLYIAAASVSRDTIIEHDGTEFVQNLSTSEYATIKKGGKQIIESGSNAEGAQIYGGEQIIWGKGGLGTGLLRKDKASSAYSTKIYAEDGVLGQQNIYSGGIAFDTKVMKGGIQNLDGQASVNNGFLEDSDAVDTEDEDFTINEGAFALNTELFKDGMQNIFAGGNASEVTLYDHAIQKIYDSGYVDTLTINHQAQSWGLAGAILDKDTNVNDFGSLYLYAGNGGSVTEVGNLILNGEDSKLYLIATENNDKKPLVKIQSLKGNGRVIFTSSGSDKYYSRLNVGNLSGSLHFDFNVDFSKHRGDYLSIKKGAGHHTISVTDSGREITNYSHKELKLISDRSGKAHFTLTNTFGEKIGTVDAGAYRYSLKHRNNKNDGKIWYLDTNYAIDETNTSSFSDSNLQLSTASPSNDLTKLIIEKGMIVTIADPSFDSSSEKVDGNGETSISNTVRDGGKLSVYNGGFSLYTKIESGGVEVIKTQSLSQDSTVHKGGQQRIEEGGKAEDAKISGGEQFVSGKSDIKGKIVKSSAYSTVISGENGERGYQNVYDDGEVFNTKIKSGGIQNLYVEGDLDDYSSFASNTEVFSGGEQHVLAGGIAIDVTLQGTAFQAIDLGGYVKDLIIKNQAQSWLHPGATLEGSTMIHDSGRIYLYAGPDQSRTEVEKIVLNDRDTRLYAIASDMDGESSLIENLSGNGRVIFMSTILNPHYSKLEVGHLSGNLHFRLNTNFAEQRGDYLLIKKGEGHHTISVIDSGIEIADSSLQDQNLVLELELIREQSGNAHFTLTDFSGEKTSTIDGGAYMYALKTKDHNGGKSWYLAPLETTSTSVTPSSHTEFPIGKLPEKEENITSSQDVNINFDPYFDVINFSIREGGGILQNFWLGDDRTVHISDDGEQGALKQSMNATVEGSGILYVETGGSSKNTTVERGGSEIIGEQGISNSTIIYEGGQQKVEGGGTALQTTIYGGDQLIWGDSYENGGIVGSSAYDTILYGQGETPGQQNVYDDGMAVETKVMSGGIQTLAKWFPDDDNFAEKAGGLAISTEVFEGGVQRVLAGGEANTVTLHRHAAQEVHAGGIVKNLRIEERANSWVFSGAMLGGEITVQDFGQLHLYAGDDHQQTKAENINLDGEEAKLYSVASEIDDKSTHVQQLSGVGKVIFTSSEDDLYYSKLYVDNLSGSLHFDFNVSLAEGKGDYLFIENGSGSHTINVADSGIEIVNPFSTELDLILDQSGGASFTLQSFSDARIGMVDGGTYIYGLKHKNIEDEEGKIWYLTAVYMDSAPREQRRRSRFARHLSQNQPVSSLSTLTNTQEHTIKLQRQRENRRNSNSKSSTSVSSVVSILGSQMIKGAPPASHSPLSSDRQQAAVSVSSQSLADQMILRPSNQKQPSPQLDETLSGFQFLTTPSTDAVLSMSVAPAMIFHNEMQSVRAGRGILDKSKKHTALWGYAIKAKESIATEHIDFKLDQSGIVLGINGLSEWENGEFYIGGFGSYDHARVAHTRGGTSGINSYSIGAYVTYVDHSGWYLDALLKYNHYQNNLKAVSTNGLGIEGSYKQWAVGASFEAGYRFQTSKSSWLQPYGQFTWLQVEGKEIKLSNDMSGDIRPFTSLRSEVGLSLGYEFGSGMATSSQAYITAAWLRENKDDNQTVINEHHSFTTDLSGNAGKLGIGLSSFLSEKLKLYGEAHYVKGRKTKQSLQGIIGVRYRF
ncbi:BafA family autotransporter [Bartonella krasnovii]|uniref:Autotransporter outer membrane beta-barrel domain-containing protein n=1 Tax=Bartonella krasnovii TaxID=2267275 RepID=A0A5B9D000_9HYPH|nr:BafA family autotransporter [Bartonella krasnovii]QEE11846.1 autotransporter outer membrane beta-barrel domain-containing protein [Bartonella krasnovii]UNF42659.1 BafA family autotransporter [Bartonella krasnovii]UNF54166.1 BafA family autotransporter [Bartonella krasnovii]UNF55871.1 BafA family autotransporter [Bartonella krasnovii]